MTGQQQPSFEEGMADLAWTSLERIASDIKDPKISHFSSETPEGAEDHIAGQFELIRAMVAAVDVRDLEALKACIAPDKLVFAYTSNIRQVVSMIEEGY